MSQDIVMRGPLPEDDSAIRLLHARAFGPGRFARTAYRVREGGRPHSPFCRVCVVGERMAATVCLTAISIGGKRGALLLGPLAVEPVFAGQGYGRALVGLSLDAARSAGIAMVLLVGDEPYYGRLGFSRVPRGQISLPGPVDPARLLAAELAPGSLAAYTGLVAADRNDPSPAE
jgi:predicted N-acetyltransferase YhbS